MATLALSIAGQFAGGIVGGPFGATLGRAVGALAGSAIDNVLFSKDKEVVLPSPFSLQGSGEGGAIPRIYGWNRVTGNIIWATQLERQTVENAGAKGIQNNTQEDQIVANFAIGLCEGEVAHLGRIWADGRLLETEGLNFRFYHGTFVQPVDSLIQAKQGTDNSPAYRGLCYLVFEGLPLGEFGNRIPNISVELCRVVGDLEPSLRAITIIPGATEFGYDPAPRIRILSPGKTQGENTSMLGQQSDWSLSLDQLQSLCPNLEHVALVVSWFGNDLRCGQCLIQPRVEALEKTVSDTSWIVSGNSRGNVPLVTQYGGGPAFGGTPSDGSILAAIADLKARGIKVTLYPFVMMDIAQENVLPDPYSDALSQSAYPWRGRITCSPAPDRPGTPDKTIAATTQVDAFVGAAQVADFAAGTSTVTYEGAADWGYRRLVLHYAKLAQIAGGVDAMLIGSELRGLTTIRASATSFPFVDALVDLAGDVRTILGPSTKLTYGADWSEYSGYQPADAPGDKLFHLDDLWASANIDAVGIDNYMPLSDWRDEEIEPDGLIADNPYQIDYLKANIAGGEGFDWYYASAGDRKLGARSDIVDGAYAEPWIWRSKDIKSWWSNAHHNRIGGVRSANPTNWMAQSKPIWLTELGCGAVDKGSNQPNVFGDDKSVENAKPYFSTGTPDEQIQRQFLRAHHQWWQSGTPDADPANNPMSNIYAGQMLDPERIYAWTWDARPFPAFPDRQDIWADGKNHATGHWLTGRLGTMSSAEFLAKIADDYGLEFSQIGEGKLLAHGVQITNIVSLRSAIEPFMSANGFLLRDAPDGLQILGPGSAEKFSIERDFMADGEGPILSRHMLNADEQVGQLSLGYVDKSVDYQTSTVTAISGTSPNKANINTNIVLDGSGARRVVEKLLTQKLTGSSLDIALPFSQLALEIGDEIQLKGQGGSTFIVNEVRSGNILKLSASVKNDAQVAGFQVPRKRLERRLPSISALPEIFAAHIPGNGGDVAGTQLLIAAFSEPWPGSIALTDTVNSSPLIQLSANGVMGELLADLKPAASNLWDRTNQIYIKLYGGHLSSANELDVLNGANRVAVLHEGGDCEIISFAFAELIAPNQYRLSNLLRGQDRTLVASQNVAGVGNRVLLLNNAVRYLPLENSQLATEFLLSSYAGPRDIVGQPVTYALAEHIPVPLPPSHVRAKQINGSNDVYLSWQRRSQIGGDEWSIGDVPLDFFPSAFEIKIFDGVSLKRTQAVSQNYWEYSSADQLFDFGLAPHEFNFSICQLSDVHGAGSPGLGNFAI